MNEEQLKEAAKAAAKQRFDDLMKLHVLLFLSESLEDALFQGLVSAFEVGFVVGHMAGRAYAYMAAEAIANEIMGAL